MDETRLSADTNEHCTEGCGNMKEKAWQFQVDVIGYGDDPDEAWSNLLLYSLKEPPPYERMPQEDIALEDDDDDEGVKKVDIAIYLFMEAEIEMQEVEVSRMGIREYATQKADSLRHV